MVEIMEFKNKFRVCIVHDNERTEIEFLPAIEEATDLALKYNLKEGRNGLTGIVLVKRQH